MLNMKINITMFVLSLLIAVGAITVLNTVHVDHYTNMSDEQADNQVAQAFNAMVLACSQAGGQWIVGAADAGCTTDYPQPDFSQEVVPQVNPWHQPWEMIQTILVVLAFLAGMFALANLSIVGEYALSHWRQWLPSIAPHLATLCLLAGLVLLVGDLPLPTGSLEWAIGRCVQAVLVLLICTVGGEGVFALLTRQNHHP